MLFLPFSLMCLSDNDYLLPNFHMLNLCESTQQAFCYPQATCVLIFLIFVEGVEHKATHFGFEMVLATYLTVSGLRIISKKIKDPTLCFIQKPWAKQCLIFWTPLGLLILINRLHLNHLFPHVIILSLAGINSPKFCLSLGRIFLVLSLFRYQLLLKCRS